MDENFVSHSEEQYVASQQPARPLPHYTCDVKQATEIFADNGFRVAPRTITSYCKSSLLDCEKFINGKVTKWKITRQSIDERIETLNREGNFLASISEQQPVSMPAGKSEQQPAETDGLIGEFVEVLKDELIEKNKQITEYQSIIHTQNKQFENLNKTIQLSNQTIQQLNNVLALPQMKEYVEASKERETHEFDYEDPVPKPIPNESDDEPAFDSVPDELDQSNMYSPDNQKVD